MHTATALGGAKAPLIAWMTDGATDIRVHAGVIKRASQNSHGSRTCFTASEGPIEISALTGRDTADNQPEGKYDRSDVHF
ncbi:MAG: hypothetical protein WAK82_02750 [Streptosporangiaceae bacterium]